MPHGLPPDLPFPDPDEVTDLQWLLLEVQRIQGCEATKAEFVRLLKGQAGKTIHFTHRVLTRPDQMARARQLLANNPVPVARDRLCAQYGISIMTAYRWIQQALTQRSQEHTTALRQKQQPLL